MLIYVHMRCGLRATCKAQIRNHSSVDLTRFHCSRGIRAWKRLVDRPFRLDERISLITDIISDRNEIEVVTGLNRDDAQAFVDAVDEVLATSPSQRNGCAYFSPNSPTILSRC